MDRIQFNEERAERLMESMKELSEDEKELFRFMLVRSVESSMENLGYMRQYIPVRIYKGRMSFSDRKFKEEVKSFAEKHLDQTGDIEEAYIVLFLLVKIHGFRAFMEES